MQILINSLIESFVLTLILEYIIIKIIFVKRKVFMPVLLVNLLTNPLVVYIYNVMSVCSFVHKDMVLVFLELLVVVVEGCIYKYLIEITWKKALLISFISNMFAYVFGLLINLYMIQ